jgi:hypothetical protein
MSSAIGGRLIQCRAPRRPRTIQRLQALRTTGDCELHIKNSNARRHCPFIAHRTFPSRSHSSAGSCMRREKENNASGRRSSCTTARRPSNG